MPKINSDLLDIDSQSLEVSGTTLEAKLTSGGNLKKTATGIDVDETKVELIASKGVANGYCALDANILIPASNIPSSAKSSVNIVANIAARNALTPKESDIVIVTDASGDIAVTAGRAVYTYTGSAWELIEKDDLAEGLNWHVVRADLGDIAPYYELLETGVYSLPAGNYLFEADVNFGNDRLQLTDDEGFYVFRSSNFRTLSYTGTDPFIYNRLTTTGTILDMKHFILSTTTATAVEIKDGNSLISNLVAYVFCKLAINVDVCAFVTLNNHPMVGCTDGMVLKDVDTLNGIVVQFNAGSGSGTGITLLGAASGRASFTQIESRPSTNEAYMDIQATYSGDIQITGGVHTTGAGVFFKVGSRNQDDIDVGLAHVKNVKNSVTALGAYIADGDEALTTISAPSTPVVIAGSWTIDSNKRFTGSGAGLFTYTGKEDVTLMISATLLIDPASGSNKTYWGYIRKGGSTLNELSRDTVTADAANPVKMVLNTIIDASTGDTFEIVISNETDSTDVTAIATNLLITGM